jgi:hypothetical protein
MTWIKAPNAVITATLLCFAPLLAHADAASDARLAAMEQRMNQLEEKLAASEKTIAEQEELLNTKATPAVGAGSEPEHPLDPFLARLNVGGYVSASYVYNANNPDNPIYAQALNQFNLDHNTFNLDAADIDISMAADAPGRAGFQLDINYGNNAQILNGFFGNTSAPFASDNNVEVEQMNVSYNWNDIVFKAGKFDTLLGYEVIDITANKQVTQGVLFTYAIPLYHTGLLASGKFNEEFGWQAGVTNGWNNSTDLNDNKGLLAQLNFASGPFSTALTSYYGSDGNTGFAGQSVQNTNTDRALVLDWVGSFKASDTVSLWSEIDWAWQKDVEFTSGPNAGSQFDAHWYGAMVGGSWQATEKMYLSARGEILRDSKGYRIAPGNDITAYTLTGTLGYNLTTNLLGRLEVRYDDLHADQTSEVSSFFPQGGCAGFNSGCGSSRDLQYIASVAYVFD